MGRATSYCGSALGPPKKQTFAANDLGKAASLALTQAQKAERADCRLGFLGQLGSKSRHSSLRFVHYFAGPPPLPVRGLTADKALPCGFAPFFPGLLVCFVAMFVSFCEIEC
jgi:hypothetical protein